jgi:hypothetical protein
MDTKPLAELLLRRKELQEKVHQLKTIDQELIDGLIQKANWETGIDLPADTLQTICR